ncbi:TPA: hypothetical protein N0F65_005478 [Lagenidium giganteum]|uniref:Uncharacterized protein n=1 Tax=Lagenidium giganteum TaxID=4803 RepID=A0AAV2YZ12_9STRA|nr:TPA: hypothetical protein N0F65_005478 [Lagenidium giganteum]
MSNQAKGTMSTRRLVAPMAPPRAKRSSSSSKKAAPTLVMMVRPPSVRAALTARSPSSGSLLMVRRDHDPVTRLDCTHLAQMNDQLPLSWWRFIRAVVAYCLLVTDVLRGGIGMRDLRDHHQVIEPDLFLFFGPWAYPVQALYSNVTDGMQTPVWPYKFDTTSIVWRAFAQHLQLDVFPPCLQYQSACPGDTFNATIAFAMIDAMVNAVAATRPRSHLARDPWLLSLRARTRFKDRLHNLLLSDALNNKIWRTNQAVYYRTNVVVAPDFRICFDRRVDLMLCGDSWTNFQRACASTDADCLAIGNIWLHIVRRVRQVQAQFPDHTVDLTLLLSSEDLLVNLGGISLSARRAADVSSIVRARKCSRHNSSSIFNATACETVYVEDYRHEVLFFQTDADEWFHCVALLRLSAQVYVILRLIALAMSCVASQRRAKQPVWQAFRLFWRAPPQTIIYGSQFPIVCYALAHLIDAPITYEMINQHFTTPIGKYKFQPLAFVTIAATQMRNIWLLALFAHALFGWLALRSSGVRLNIEGVLGMPARWLAILSSLTILSQLRSLSFRDTHVLNTYEIPASTRVSLLRKTTCVSANRGLNNAVMDGIIIDLKVFGCLIIVLVAAQLVCRKCTNWTRGYRTHGGAGCVQSLRLGLDGLSSTYNMVEPDVLQFFGPWAYPVNILSSNTSSTPAVAAWTYKFDTTSISWRAVARYLQVEAFPTCLLYESVCDSDKLDPSRAFDMIDEVASAVANYSTQNVRASTLSLHARTTFVDRLHHFMMPKLFLNDVLRVVQAAHFSPALLDDPTFSICHRRAQRLMLCEDSWPNFARACPRNDAGCREVGLVWRHIMGRVRQTQTAHPNKSVDLTLLISSDAVQINRGGLTMSGKRASDISTIIRIRDCLPDASNGEDRCETTELIDFRYEMMSYTTDVEQWFKIVALLRISALSYFYVRLATLFASCWLVVVNSNATPGHTSRRRSWRRAIALFARAPSQAIVYGSRFPVLCYAVAHLVDAPIAYETINHHFTTPVGAYKLNVRHFITIAAIQMRNIWSLALLVQFVVSMMSSRKIGLRPAVNGVLGVPAFWMGVLSSCTILSQLSALAFRDTRVLRIDPILGTHRVSITLRNHVGPPTKGQSNALLEGVLIDVKFFLGAMLGLASLQLLHMLITTCCSESHRLARVWYGLGFASTPASYAAGTLWPTSALCVRWYASYFHADDEFRIAPGPLHDVSRLSVVERVAGEQAGYMRAPRGPHSTTDNRHQRTIQLILESSRQRDDASALEYTQYLIERVHERIPNVLVVIAFINTVVLSDPWSWFRTQIFHGYELRVFESRKRPGKTFLLPIDVNPAQFDVQELRLIQRVQSTELTWVELIHCG